MKIAEIIMDALKKIFFVLIFSSLLSCNSIPYDNIGSNFVKNYCKGKEFFEDTLYFTNEFVDNHKKIINPNEITCDLFRQHFKTSNTFNYIINGGFYYTRRYENDDFLDTIKKENVKQIFYIKSGDPKEIVFSLVLQNGIWKIHHFKLDITNHTLDPVED